MKKTKVDQKPQSKWYGELTREYLGFDYDKSKIDMEKYRGVMPRPEGYYKEYAIGKEPPPEGHVDDTPHGRSIIDRGQVLNPPEVDENYNYVDGFDRGDVALRHGIPCPIVMVRGLREDQVADYITEVNTARRDLDPRVRADLTKLYITRDEEAFKAGKVTYRSTYNKIAVICGTTQRRVRQIERSDFPERWVAACAGETRITQNGKSFEVKEADPDSQIKGLLGKLGEDTPVDQQEAAIRALRETLEKHGDVLAGKERKEIKAQVDEADRRARERRASEERARLAAAQASAVGGNEQPAADKEEVVVDPPVAWFVRFRAELQEEVEALEDTVLTLREWAAREEHPLSAALLRVMITAELISVEEDQGEEVVRVEDPDLVAALASAETALDPIFRRLGVTLEIAARHLLAMVREGRGLSLEPPVSGRKAKREAAVV